MPLEPLPIDPLLPEIVAALRAESSLVIEAPPGAGKTTRVPRALLDAQLFPTGEILILEPRRLPVRLAARRVAEELGEEPGRTVGYTVRFEEVGCASTRIRFVTEGILTRRLLSDPGLRGVACVILDELHERHLESDLALALVHRLQLGARPELRLVAMSATLDAAPLAEFLGARSLRSEGRRFPLTIEHDERPDERYLDDRVAGAVKRLLRDGLDGDVLVFLPGAAEIRRAAEKLAAVAESADLLVLPLHGDLSPAEQDRAVRRASKRKIILSTNVAESSVTIDGVSAVIDSGLARIAGHSPWSGLPTLSVAKISRASATQRAGRAGRTRAGKVLRLYTKHDHDSWPERDLPEIARLDLAGALLTLHGAGVAQPGEFPWYEAPPAPALAAAEGLLQALGALDSAGALTDLGRRMGRLPAHPRLSRLVLEGEKRGVGAAACIVAALCGERDIRRDGTGFGGGGGGGGGGRRGRTAMSGPSDLLELLERFREAEQARFAPARVTAMGLTVRGVEAVDRARKQLSRLVRDQGPRPATPEAEDQALQLATLTAFPDRVAQRRRPNGRELVLADGGSAELSEQSVVHEASLLVAVEVEERAQAGRAARTTVRLASAIEADWLLDLFPERLEDREELCWNEQAERVDRRSTIAFGLLALSEDVRPAPPSEGTARLLAERALSRGLAAFGGGEALARLQGRLAFLAKLQPEAGFPAVGEAGLRAALAAACRERRSFAELAKADLAAELLGTLTPAQAKLLRSHAPERLQLPGGRGVEVHYPLDAGPFIEARLQDFFGMTSSPAIGGGKVPLTLHLNAPNGRAVQVTQDLAGFWERHYPAIRRELMRRYPRHLWPEDGRSAKPPPPGKPR